jgi:PEP-CTERM motif
VPINPSLITLGGSPQDIAVNGSDLYVTDNQGGTVAEYNANTGAPINTSLITGLQTPIGIAVVSTCSVDCDNIFNDRRISTAYSFNLTLKGDVLGQLNLAATATDPFVNPFAYVNNNFFAGSGTSSVTASLDGNGNTVVTYTGSHPILPSYSFNYGCCSNDPHFGFAGDTVPLINIAQAWNYGVDGTQTLPNLSIACPAASGPVDQYAVFFAEVSTVNGDAIEPGGGQWTECGVSADTNLAFLLTNTTLMTEELSDVGFFLSDISIPLDALNLGGTLPPDQPDSPFTQLPQYDGLILLPDQSVSVGVAEPSTLALLGTGLSALCVWRRRRSHASAKGAFRV